MKNTNLCSILNATEDEISEIIENKNHYYLSYKIPKRNKGKREIDCPVGKLKEIQNVLLRSFFYRFRPNKIAHGFIKNRSPKTNAQAHIGAKIIIKIDLKNFFNSIKKDSVDKLINRLNMSKVGSTILGKEKDSYANIGKPNIITELVTYKGRLPQGSPTSPAITNLYCNYLDNDLAKLGRQYESIVTRYADDITISSKTNKDLPKIIGHVIRILKKYKFQMNKRKLKIIRNNKKMTVTGITVNQKLNIDRTTRRNLRAELHNLVTSGTHLNELDYQKLRGRIEWVKTLNPQLGTQFLIQLGKIKYTK